MPPPASSVRAEAAALRSSTAYVQDLETSTVLFAKNENVVRPIASISKLMTAVVVVDANQPMNEMLEITDDDIDGLKHTTSRLRVGTRRRHAAPGADVFREPRRQRAGPQLPAACRLSWPP